MTLTGISIWTTIALLAASAVLLAVLHRLRIRPQTVWINTTLFWNQALRRTRARSLWERFRHPLTYILLLLIASLLIMALANPRPSIDARDQEHTVFVLDLSSSMSVVSSNDQTRLDQAKQKLTELVDQFAWPEGFAVVVAGSEPRLLHAMGDLRPMLEHRLESIQAAAMPTDRQQAVRLAGLLLEGRERPSVCLITDRPFDPEILASSADDQQDVAGVPSCRVVQVGEPISNAAILSAIFEPDQKNPLVGTLRVRAGVWPKGEAIIKITARRERGPILSEKELVVSEKNEPKNGLIVELEVEQLAADGGTVVVEISGDDALRVDSVVRYQLPVRRPIRVLVENEVPGWLDLLMKLDPTLVLSNSNDANVKLRVAASEPLAGPAQVVEMKTAAEQASITGRAGLDTSAGTTFEDLYCTAGIPRDHFDDSITPLVTVDKHLIAASQPTAPCPTLWLADVAWNDDSPVIRSAAWPLIVSRSIRELADWTASPISLTPTMIQQIPEMDVKQTVAMPGSRAASDLTAVEASEASTSATSFFTASQHAWTEWLLLVTLALAVAEIILHTRGKIA